MADVTLFNLLHCRHCREVIGTYDSGLPPPEEKACGRCQHLNSALRLLEEKLDRLIRIVTMRSE